jgi:trk system potassium uptake protein TrkA
MELLKTMDVVTVADRDEAKCRELAERLDDVEIQHGSGTSRPFLEDLDVRHVHTFVATTGDDEVNLMATLLSKQLGAEQAIALVQRPDYAAVYSDLGIDYTVSPRLLVSAEIIRFLNRRRLAREHRIPTDGSVVIEHEIADGSHLAGKRLFDLELPHGVVPVAVTRGRVILPDPELVRLEARDVIVVFSPERAVAGARRLLLRR